MLLENQKNVQNTPDSRTVDINRNKLKSTNPFFLPKKSSSNIKPPSSNLITTSNSFDLLSENTKKCLDTSNVISAEITILSVTETKATNQLIPVSQPGKRSTSDTTERNKSSKKRPDRCSYYV